MLILRGSAELPLEDEFAHSADTSRSNLAAALPLLSRRDFPNPCSRHRPLHTHTHDVTRGRSRLMSVRRIECWRVGGDLMWASQTHPSLNRSDKNQRRTRAHAAVASRVCYRPVLVPAWVPQWVLEPSGRERNDSFVARATAPEPF